MSKELIVKRLRNFEQWIRDPKNQNFTLSSDLFDEAANRIEELESSLWNNITNITKPQIQEHHETMRDRFAMAALTSFKTNADVWHQAKRAYEIADAMLKARKMETE